MKPIEPADDGFLNPSLRADTLQGLNESGGLQSEAEALGRTRNVCLVPETGPSAHAPPEGGPGSFGPPF